MRSDLGVRRGLGLVLSMVLLGTGLAFAQGTSTFNGRALDQGDAVLPGQHLLPVLTGIENVELPMLVGGVKPSEARRRAQEAIEMVGVGEWARHRPAEMSGGQRQRFTIARALSTRPAIVWADEPTGALDTETSAGIMDLMVQLNRQNAQTFVWVTHAEEVGALAQRLIRMRDGQIVSDSKPAITGDAAPQLDGSRAAADATWVD